MTPEQAKASYEAMADEDKLAVTKLVKAGKPPREAVRLVGVGQQGDVVRAASNAKDEADILTSEAPIKERVGAAAMGAADSASFGLAPIARGTMTFPSALASLVAAPLGPPAIAMASKLAAGEKFDEGYRAQEEARASAGGGDDITPLSKQYSQGHGVMDALNILGVGVGGAAQVAREVGAAGVSALKPQAGALGKIPAAFRRLKGAANEVTRETLEGGAPPTKMGALRRSLEALVGHGGDAEKLIVEAEKVAPTEKLPDWLTLLTDDAASTAGKVEASGLDVVRRPPPIPKPKPRAPRKPPAETPPAAPGPAAAKGPMVPLNEHALPGEPGYGVMVSLDDALEMAATGKMPKIPPPHTPNADLRPTTAPAPPARPRGEAELKAAVADGVKRGVPLKELAKELGVNQGDIAAWFKGAQLGF